MPSSATHPLQRSTGQSESSTHTHTHTHTHTCTHACTHTRTHTHTHAHTHTHTHTHTGFQALNGAVFKFTCCSIHTSCRRQPQPTPALHLFPSRFFYLYHFIPYAFYVRMNGIYWMFPFLAHWCLLQVRGVEEGGGGGGREGCSGGSKYSSVTMHNIMVLYLFVCVAIWACLHV